MTWLITGGAGFIGSHVVRAMTRGGERVVVVDDLSTGRADRLPQGVPWRPAPSWTGSSSTTSCASTP